MLALIDSEKRRGANKYTAYRQITDTHKECSWCKQLKLHSEFHKDKTSIRSKGLAYYCKECANQKTREFHKKHLSNSAYQRQKRSNAVKLRTGLTLQQYEEKLIAQGNVCAICEIALLPSGYGTHLDHNHTTGHIRDFLCTNCNRGLGHFQDSQKLLLIAAKYLETHNGGVDPKKGDDINESSH